MATNNSISITELELERLFAEKEELEAEVQALTSKLSVRDNRGMEARLDSVLAPRITRAAWVAFIYLCALTRSEQHLDFSPILVVALDDPVRVRLPVEEVIELNKAIVDSFGHSE